VCEGDRESKRIRDIEERRQKMRRGEREGQRIKEGERGLETLN
jgi:hypothetical protein